MISFSFVSTWRWAYVVAAVVSAGAVFWGVNWWLGPRVDVERVQRRDFVQTVVASGHVESPHRVDIGAQMTATVTRIPVREGSVVHAHDVLIELAAADLQATQRQADLAVAQAQGRLRQMQEVQAPVAEQALRQAQVQLTNARAVWQRNQALFAQGFIGQAALDEVRKSLELADAQEQSARKQLDSARPAGSDYAIALSAVRGAQAAADAARAKSDYAVIRAPMDGTLISRNVEVGDVAQPGRVLMTLSPAGATQLVLAIDEKNLHLVALGQAAVVSADAYPQQHFEAKLAYINPGINAQTGAVEVKLDVDQPPDFLRQDMTVSVDIEVARRTQTLVLNAALVRDAGGPAPWVLVAQSGRAIKVPVTVGLRGGGVLEIVQGLREGDLVLQVAPALAVGAHVRPRVTPP